MALSIRPIHNNIVVKELTTKPKSESNLFIPDSATEKPNHGLVVAVGRGIYHEKTGQLIEPQVAVGDVVLFGKFSGTATVVGGVKYLIIKEPDITGILQDS